MARRLTGVLKTEPGYSRQKSALDFLYAEWRDKPAAVASYSTRGGNRAVARLRGVLQGLPMRIIDQNLELVVTDADVDEDEQLTDVAATLQPFTEQVRLVDAQLAEPLTNASGDRRSAATWRQSCRAQVRRPRSGLKLAGPWRGGRPSGGSAGGRPELRARVEGPR
ncbi:NADPH-dependent FMN reductase [Streptomyces sp. NPDC127033]|uniref:NADPH-dependent FMN reductase n=1 Tax=Streptomyces sp. NPDC127033 TaxID=3347110 RepID=UPI00364E86A1